MRTLGFVSKPRGQTINGPVLRVLREKVLKIDITKAAALIDVSPAIWSKWELGGRRISDESLERLVDVFQLDGPAPLLASTAFDAELEAERQRVRRTVAA